MARQTETGGIELDATELTNLVGYLETIVAEAEGLPQIGGNEATIIEQADGALELLMIACGPCSIAGGADRAVYHLPPECPNVVLSPSPGRAE